MPQHKPFPLKKRGAPSITKTKRSYDAIQLEWARRVLAAPEGSHTPAEIEVALLTRKRLEDTPS